jgi:hypothetical protein
VALSIAESQNIIDSDSWTEDTAYPKGESNETESDDHVEKCVKTKVSTVVSHCIQNK